MGEDLRKRKPASSADAISTASHLDWQPAGIVLGNVDLNRAVPSLVGWRVAIFEGEIRFCQWRIVTVRSICDELTRAARGDRAASSSFRADVSAGSTRPTSQARGPSVWLELNPSIQLHPKRSSWTGGPLVWRASRTL